jgi:hypothetical protein
MMHQIEALAEQRGDEAIPRGVGLLQRAHQLLLQIILLDHHAVSTILKRSGNPARLATCPQRHGLA